MLIDLISVGAGISPYGLWSLLTLAGFHLVAKRL
jgi:hypothetical protein